MKADRLQRRRTEEEREREREREREGREWLTINKNTKYTIFFFLTKREAVMSSNDPITHMKSKQQQQIYYC